jgi:hypothetical protein
MLTSNNFVGAFDSVGIKVFFARFGFGHELLGFLVGSQVLIFFYFLLNVYGLRKVL